MAWPISGWNAVLGSPELIAPRGRLMMGRGRKYYENWLRNAAAAPSGRFGGLCGGLEGRFRTDCSSIFEGFPAPDGHEQLSFLMVDFGHFTPPDGAGRLGSKQTAVWRQRRYLEAIRIPGLRRARVAVPV